MSTDPRYSDLIHSPEGLAQQDRIIRAVADRLNCTYLEGFGRLADWANQAQRNAGPNVTLSRVLAEGGQNLRTLEAAADQLDGKAVKRLLDRESKELASAAPVPAGPVPVARDVDRLGLLGHVDPNTHQLEGPAREQARRDYQRGVDAGLAMGPYDESFERNWAQSLRDGTDYVATEGARQLEKSRQRALSAARERQRIEHDRRVREERRSGAANRLVPRIWE